MADNFEKNLSTILFHEEKSRIDFQTIAPPIFQTSNFDFETFEGFVEGTSEEENHYIYTRGGNPTTRILEEKLMAIEGAEAAKVFSSGMAAISSAIFSLVKSGDHILVLNIVYGSASAFIKSLERFGVSHSAILLESAHEIPNHIQKNTKVIYFESPSGQLFKLLDLETISIVAKKQDIVTIIDNTWSSPLFQKPTQYGIDLVIHSLSKYIGGHSDLVGGIVMGKEKFIRGIHSEGLQLLGGAISPNNAWLAIRGLRTLSLRMNHADESIRRVLDVLSKDSRINRIFHPYLAIPAQHGLADKYLSGFGSLFSFDLSDQDFEKMKQFVNALQIFKIAVSWGGYESLVLPSNRGIDDEKLRLRGLSSTHLRCYIGLEDTDLLIADIKQALDKAYGGEGND